MMEMDYVNDRMDDGFTQIQKIGSVGRAPRLNDLNDLASELKSKTNKQLLYDVYYGHDPEFKSIHYTEIFSHAIMITHCDDVLRYEMVIGGVEDESVVPFDPSELLSKQLDKYRLVRQAETHPLPAVIFLPGSNLLEHNVDWQFVYKLYKAGAKIKPHPITLNDWLLRIEESFPGAVYSNHVSGHDLLQRAEVVYCTSASEMGLLAKLMNKPIGLVDADHEGVNRHIYRQLYEIIRVTPDPKAALCRLLASPHSGIYWLHDDPSKLDRILSLLDQLHSDHYAPSTHLNLGVSYEFQSEEAGFNRQNSFGRLGMDAVQPPSTTIDLERSNDGPGADARRDS